MSARDKLDGSTMSPHDALTTLITSALALAHGHGRNGVTVDYRAPLAEALAVVDSQEFRDAYGVERDWTSGDPVDDGEPIPWRKPSETVTTWADGFGIWHARVTFPSPGYGPDHLAANIDRIRAKARRAIRREILERAPRDARIGAVRVHVSANSLDHMNVMRSITFAEVAE